MVIKTLLYQLLRKNGERDNRRDKMSEEEKPFKYGEWLKSKDEYSYCTDCFRKSSCDQPCEGFYDWLDEKERTP